jgi:hypothetical protein
MQVRRVVTGQTADGTSVLVSDELVQPVTSPLLSPSAAFHLIWGSDALVGLPTDGAAPATHGYFPPPGGFRFGFFSVAPDVEARPAGVDVAAALAELRATLPGLLDVMEPDQPGMHRTDTVDFVLVVSGEVWLELDNGAEVHLRQGDCVIQNGTRHAWRNKSTAPCTLAFAIVGAERTSDQRAAVDRS